MTAFAGRRFLLIVENNSVPFDKRVWREATALRECGATVIIISPIGGTDHLPYEVKEGVVIYRYPLAFADGTVKGYLKEYLFSFFHTIRLFHHVLMRHGAPDVVHVANPPDIFWPLSLYVRFFGARFVFDEHDLTPETYLSRFERGEGEEQLLYKILVLFQHLSYRFSHAIISTNESYKANAIAVDQRYRRKVFVVRNGPDTRTFSLVAQRTELKEDFRYMAAYIGIMGLQDGVEYIIRAMHILVNERKQKDLLVYLIGSGDDVPRLQSLVETLNLTRYIRFTGRIPDGPALEILSTADLCLSPDPFNPLNDRSTMNKVMEYMSLGKPIVSFSLTEATYSARDAALYVENNSASSFADGMQYLLANPERAQLMGKIGHVRIIEHLCWQRQIASLVQAYGFVLGK
jgi:glycosyltransferase involved in cell wall biosynthesis